jgi:hypothetical protein
VSDYGSPDSSLTEAEWAWCAGLFEGEGCITFEAKTAIRLAINMTDRDVPERLDSLWPSPGGVRLMRMTEAERPKPMWHWRISSRDRVRGFLIGIYPWLGARRRARADEAMKRLGGNPGKDHCNRGHALTGSNIEVRRGVRRCLLCEATR